MVTEGKILSVKKMDFSQSRSLCDTYICVYPKTMLLGNALAESWSSDGSSESVMRLINSQWHLLGALPENSEGWKSLDRAWIIP